MEAFKPKGFIFLHCCANCKYGKKIVVTGSALNHICMKDTDKVRHLSGTHICDVDVDGIGEQMSWFDDLKEEE